jgi:hypothetical protein
MRLGISSIGGAFIFAIATSARSSRGLAISTGIEKGFATAFSECMSVALRVRKRCSTPSAFGGHKIASSDPSTPNRKYLISDCDDERV